MVVGEGVKRINSTRFLFMDTVNAKVGSLFSVSISLIAILFSFLFLASPVDMAVQLKDTFPGTKASGLAKSADN